MRRNRPALAVRGADSPATENRGAGLGKHSSPGIADRVAAYPPPGDYKHGPDGYANHLVKVKQAVRIPLIASLNGHTGESWLKFAHIIEQAGADALEFNYYDVATALTVPSAALEEHLSSAVET